MENFEKLGLFYLGKEIDPSSGKVLDHPLLYESKNFTTHAVCVGMTGSGKTGLGISLIEEAAIDGIPALIIDPKGDMANLALSFPHLSKEEFTPWVLNKDEKIAESTAKAWKEGLESFGETAERVQKFKNAVDIVIYTPANRAGRPISILSSFNAPSEEMRKDTGAMRDRVLSLTSSLLGLLGLDADPIKSREHIMISTLVYQAWEKGENLDLATLIQQIQKPPFNKIGALNLDTFFPSKERTSLAVSLNNLLASPGFQAWMEGEPLDIQKLLYTTEGKPKLAILSIAHLSDSERMFFVTLFLNEVLTWMRRQSGTNSLRALLYMDEIFGYFPPTASPPSKLPMLTLLKQARAYGLGVILSTQNPVDLDYKGLSNCGTWFIGKLQTERDKARILEGLKTSSNGEIDSDKLNQLLSTGVKRSFIMQSIYEKGPIVFQTRWTLSYLSGPLTLSQIEKLTDNSKDYLPAEAVPDAIEETKTQKPFLGSDVSEYFVRPVNSLNVKSYKPFVAGIAKLHFVDSKNNIDVWSQISLVAEADDEGKKVNWEEAEEVPQLKERLGKNPASGANFEDLPAGLSIKKNYSQFEKDLTTNLYQNHTYTIFSSPDLNLASKENETEGEFKARLTLALREKRDQKVAKIREKYGPKVETLSDKIRKGQMALAQKQEKAGRSKTDTFISMGTTLLGAIFGKGVTKGTLNQAGTSIRRAGKISEDSQSVAVSESNLANLKEKLNDLQSEMQQEIDKLNLDVSEEDVEIKTDQIRPRKTDITIETLALAWWPVQT